MLLVSARGKHDRYDSYDTFGGLAFPPAIPNTSS
jgi:hypothetical protein